MQAISAAPAIVTRRQENWIYGARRSKLAHSTPNQPPTQGVGMGGICALRDRALRRLMPPGKMEAQEPCVGPGLAVSAGAGWRKAQPLLQPPAAVEGARLMYQKFTRPIENSISNPGHLLTQAQECFYTTLGVRQNVACRHPFATSAEHDDR